MRVGLLGGSFNPAHEGHRHVAREAMRRLGLDQVWLVVSPGNPLKPRDGMGDFAARLASARALGDRRRIIATDIERRIGTHFTLDTLRLLRRRFPRTQFVWLMGADNLAQFPRWNGWLDIARAVPFAVLPRPHYTARALAGQAAQRLRAARLAPGQARRLAAARPPAWAFLPGRPHAASATAIRAHQPEVSDHRPQAACRTAPAAG